ncbi:hypothetical protein BH11ACT2_BH11ACT2_18800 [soil metagenome]
MVMIDSAPVTKAAAAQAAKAAKTAIVEEQTSGLVWESVEGVEPAAWVGRVRGIFVGMVEARWQEGYTATTRLGRKLGTFGTLGDAEEAFIVKRG